MQRFVGWSKYADSDRWQVSDFLMRVKSRRFPSIEKDMKMVLAHCGSLLLDPASLCQACCAHHCVLSISFCLTFTHMACPIMPVL